jgi:hypothetical protein
MWRSLMVWTTTGLLLTAQAAAAADGSSYAGLQDRPIKALSAQQIDDLQEGRGMGLALVAELNGYPGPIHALEAAEALGLDPAQLQETEALFAAMRAEAGPLGAAIISLEAELDGLFATGEARAPAVEHLVMRIAEVQGRLRFVHLGYHLRMRELLTAEQLDRYDQVRGYGHAGGDAHRHRH